MKLTQLSYFFEGYNFPSLRHLYPTNTDLWNAFNRQEGPSVRQDLVHEIHWLQQRNEEEQQQVMQYLNQVGIMGPIRFQKVHNMLQFLDEMKKNIAL